MYKRGLLVELSKKLIQSVAKRTVAKYQKQADKSEKTHSKNRRTQDAAGRNTSQKHSWADADLASEKRSQARRVLSKAHGRDTGKGDAFGGKPTEYTGSRKRNAVGIKTKHGLTGADLKGKGAKTKGTKEERGAGKNTQNKPDFHGTERSNHPMDRAHKSNRGTSRGSTGNTHTDGWRLG